MDCITSSFNRSDKLKTDDKSERPPVSCYGCEAIIQEVQGQPNFEENIFLLRDDEGKCQTPEQINELGEFLNLYGTLIETGGDLITLIERHINPGDNPPISVPPKRPMYRNTGVPSSPLPFSQSASTTSNYVVDGSSWSP
ncbi:hypothetical protein TNIN_299701 [Trichonephila inaurata madagascariensis]|uniref:Uncharacterized protein n=1 Tax=Trichonephila inaurata madagascariensis TaxID=2747483 RepID=A0A8X6X6L4_9ARAC|nr:hypothetical protein TNIN_299701 [Trichonephila inaurata madagascariensis]